MGERQPAHLHQCQNSRAARIEPIEQPFIFRSIDSTKAVRRCSTFRAIDDIYTAPIHGFKDADDYWTKSSSKPWLKHIQIPTLLINARNDPFLPASALPINADVSASVTLHFPHSGGHVEFISGGLPGSFDWLPRRALGFFLGET